MESGKGPLIGYRSFEGSLVRFHVSFPECRLKANQVVIR